MRVYDRRVVEISELKIEIVSVTMMMTKSSVLYLAIDCCPKVRKRKDVKGSRGRYICDHDCKQATRGLADVSRGV